MMVLGTLLVASLTVAGVVYFGGTAPADPEKATPTSVVGDRVDVDGGTLHALALGPVVTWDPQRIASRDDMAFAGRVFARTLTAYAPEHRSRRPGPARRGPRNGHRPAEQGHAVLVLHHP